MESVLSFWMEPSLLRCFKLLELALFSVKYTINVIKPYLISTFCSVNRLNIEDLTMYMSAHVLLNLLNELGKRDKMRGLPSILSLFRNEFNKFNNTRARMLDSIYHMT